jgi:hypothetical protein
MNPKITHEKFNPDTYNSLSEDEKLTLIELIAKDVQFDIDYKEWLIGALEQEVGSLYEQKDLLMHERSTLQERLRNAASEPAHLLEGKLW